jgi:hypothetical protein
MSDTATGTTIHDDRRRPLMKLADAAADPSWPWATSAAQLLRLCAQGRLRYRQIGKAYWVSADDMDAFEAAQPVRNAQP